MAWLLKANFLGLRNEDVKCVVSIILRMPGLFLLDYCSQNAFQNLWKDFYETSDLINFIISIFALTQGLLLILLPFGDLITLYMHYVSAVMIAGAELLSRHYVATEMQSDKTDSLHLLTIEQVPLPNLTHVQRQIAIISLHIIIATTISYLMDFECNIRKASLAIYSVPVAASLADFPNQYLFIVHNLATALTVISIILYCLTSLPKLVSYLRLRYVIISLEFNVHGFLNTCFETLNKVCILPQLFLYWIVLVASHMLIHYNKQVIFAEEEGTVSYEHSEWYVLVLYTISDVCNSTLSLAAFCVAVMYMSWTVLYLTKLLAKGANGLATDPALERAGMGEGITMSLLALQTGLIDLSMPHRMGAMSIILFIVVGALVQSMHEVVEPVLLSLSAANNKSIARHLRVLCLCAFLFAFPIYMTVVLCSLFDVDFWTLVVVSTCALTSVQVLGAFTVYLLFLYDSFKMDSSWEALDDVVYIARAVTRILEFLVAVLVVGAGIRESIILTYEGRPWSWMNGTVLIFHCYYNVYLRLQSGWNSFLLRRDAARKIHSLPLATPDQLHSRSHDVCAICYVEMKSARVTPCQHLFHASCLQKWLYVQDRCPLCSLKVTSDNDDLNNSTDANVQNDVLSNNEGPVNGATLTDDSDEVDELNNSELMNEVDGNTV